MRVWGEGETRLLLDQYKQYFPHVGPVKRFARKKNMWAQISSDIHTQLGSVKTELQCENRYKTLLKRRGGAVKHNNTSGSDPVPVPFKDELAQIRSIDDSISPEVLRGVGRVEQKPIATPGPSCAQNLQGSGPPPLLRSVERARLWQRCCGASTRRKRSSDSKDTRRRWTSSWLFCTVRCSKSLLLTPMIVKFILVFNVTSIYVSRSIYNLEQTLKKHLSFRVC